jgi:hypothetical protein
MDEAAELPVLSFAKVGDDLIIIGCPVDTNACLTLIV